MVDAIVSDVLELLNTMMDQEMLEEMMLVKGVSKKVRKLTSNLQTIQAVLSDAEQRQLQEMAVRRWLDQLKDASYDMEDALDEWKTARLKLQIKGDENAVVPYEKVCSFFPSSCFCFKQVVLRRDIALKIKEINKILDDIAKAKDMFRFDMNFNLSIDQPEPLQSISFVDEEIIGRDIEKNILISKLVCESSSERKGLHIISLVGKGGIGKTALARLVYNHDVIKRNFDKKIWVCVSDRFDEFKIARAIIEGLTDSFCNLIELESLMQSLYESITGKKFLLVLDDVWTEDYYKWELFDRCLKKGLPGSKILITTRRETVAHMMNSTDILSVEQLSEENCWLLFRRIALSDRSNEEREILAEIGKTIVRQCKGWPLVTKIIGSLLRFKREREEWRRILESGLWESEESEKGFLSPLLLSYNDLPSAIKRCFSFCAIFPKDHDIRKDELIQLWMAHGYLKGRQTREMEIIGGEYFDYLVSRCFFHELEKDDDGIVTRCKMHDIVHDFAQYCSGKEVLTVESNGREDLLINSFDMKVRHSMLILGEGASFPLFICHAKRLRSLFIYGEGADYSISSEVLQKLFGELKQLRALDINGEFQRSNLIKEIPKEIGKLIHLRYLNLSGQEIEKLPETLCELYNLQTLDVTWCLYLKEFPEGIGKLANLRHLINYGTRSLRYMPVGIERLTHLRTLESFVVDGGVNGSKACRLDSLKNLNLFGGCQIRGLGNVSDVGEAKRLQLQNMKNLVKLSLVFDKGEEVERMNEEDEVLLECLPPPQSLKKLMINNYGGNTFSTNWTMLLNNLRHLHLVRGLNCEHLPPLGQLLSLEGLTIWDLQRVRRMGNEFLGIESDHGSSSSSSSSIISFPKLKLLVIGFMDELEEWHCGNRSNGETDNTVMPHLSSLEIRYCPELMALPEKLLQTTTLQELTISSCPILEERYREGTGEDWPKISHIPKIIMH